MTVNMQSLIAALVATGTTFFGTYAASGSIMVAGVAAGTAFFGALSGAAAHSIYSTTTINGGGKSAPP